MKKMKLTIVSSKPDETTVAQFKQKADALGIEASVMPVTLDDIATGKADTQLGDAVLWRLSSLGPSGNGAGWGLMRNRISVNSALYVMPEIGNKYFQQQLLKHSELAEYSLPTFYVSGYEKLAQLVETGYLQYPIVVKPVHGASAQGVTYLRDAEQAKRHTNWNGAVAESYIENDGEWRVFVVGGVATGAMKKIAESGRKFNLVTPGATVYAEPDGAVRDELYDIATKAASLFHTELNGVDIVRDRNTGKLYIFEVNVSPGWQNRFDKTTGEDIPGRVMEWFTERSDAQQQSLANSIETYLVRRTHRLPAYDELRLIDTLYDISSSARLVAKMQHKRIVARAGELIAQLLRSGDEASAERALNAVDSLRRRFGVKPDDVIGENNWRELGTRAFRQNVTVATVEDIAVATAVLLRSGEAHNATPLLERIERIIDRDFFAVNIEQKLEFLQAAKKYEYSTNLGARILQQAATFRSWTGNFLVDETGYEVSTGVSTRHTLRTGAYASSLYCALMADA